MRKLMIVALTVFALAFMLGTMTPDNAGAARCYYKCTCEGIALKCCVTNGVETCGLAKGMVCLDIYPC